MEITIKNTSNFNQAVWLGIGQLMTFAISFLSAAILSRYFDKTEYGTYKQILYVYTTLQSLFTIGLPSVFAYFIPRLESGQQKTLVNSLTRLFLYLGIAFSVALYLLSDPIASLLKNPELAIGLKIFSPFPLFTLPTMGVEGIYTALRKTKTIAVYQVISKTLMVVCIIFPVIALNTGYKGAIIGWGVASFFTFLIAFYLKNKPYMKIEKELVSNMYKVIFDYSLPLMGAFFVGFFISSADQFFVSRYYGTETFAEYSNGILSIPVVAMVASSVKSVLLPLFSKANASGTMNQAVVSYNNAVAKSVVLIFPILVFSLFFAQEIMVFIYGRQYANSAVYMRYYMIKDFLGVFPYFSVLLALGLSKIYLYMHVVGAIYVWIFDYLCVLIGFEVYSIVIVKSVFYIMCAVYAFIYIYKKTKILLITSEIIKTVLFVIGHSIFCALIVYYFKTIYLSNINIILILVIAGVFYYGLLILTGFFLKINYLEPIKPLLNRRK